MDGWMVGWMDGWMDERMDKEAFSSQLSSLSYECCEFVIWFGVKIMLLVIGSFLWVSVWKTIIGTFNQLWCGIEFSSNICLHYKADDSFVQTIWQSICVLLDLCLWKKVAKACPSWSIATPSTSKFYSENGKKESYLQSCTTATYHQFIIKWQRLVFGRNFANCHGSRFIN